MSRMAATLLAIIGFVCAGQAQKLQRFTVDHQIKFEAGTGAARRAFMTIPEAREVVEGEFAIATEDLNDDGRKEFILIARSSQLCSDSRCSVIVLERKAGKLEPLFTESLAEPLAVTKEKIGDYRAIAVSDNGGQIVFGNKKGTPMFHKQMVYGMKMQQMESSKASR